MSAAGPARVAVAALCTLCAGCGNCARSSGPGTLRPVEASVSVADSGLAPARCAVDRFVTLDADGELGEATSTPSGFAVGVTRRVGGQRLATVAIVSDDLSDVAYADLGPAFGDDPVPRPFSRGADVLVARYVRGRAEAGTTRELEIHRVDAKSADRVLSVPQGLDESFAFDLAFAETGALLAWDEDGPKGRGVITVAPLEASLDKLAAPAARVTPEASDAEAPRLAARPGGFWLVWVARRPEAGSDASDDAHALEGPGEVRTFEWLEAVALDARGKPLGDVRRVTPSTGHVALFELAVSGMDLDVVYRDDAEPAEGAGGRIVRVRVRDGGVEAPVELVRAGAGKGAPDLFAVGPAWLSYADLSDRFILVPLGKTRDPAGLPSEEAPLAGGRLLAASRREGGGFLGGNSGEKIILRKIACRRAS